MARGDIHVVPLGDLIEHTDSRGCICRPAVVDAQPDGTAVVVHHSADGREYFEPGSPAVEEVLQ